MMKVFAGLIVLAALAMGAAMVVGGRVPVVDNRQMTPIPVASPADTFVVHDAPSAAPAAAVPTPSAPDPAPPASGGLEATIQRLRAANGGSDATPPDPGAAPSDATPPPVPSITITAPPPGPSPLPAPATALAAPATAMADPLLAGPNPAPSVLAGPPPAPPPPVWTVVTSQGVRWRGAPNSLTIDMGGGRTATVFVDPAFQALPQDAASARVDFLKQTILESFPRGATQFRFARDGSVSLVR